MYWILAILILGVVIFVHEMGHFLVARRKGIPVEVFSIGFGPRLIGIRRNGTDYRISAIPIGGYVLPKLKDLDDLHRIPVGKRVAFSLGGPMANFMFATILLAIFNMTTSGPSLINMTLYPLIQCASVTISMIGSFGMLITEPGSMSGAIGMASQGGSFMAGSISRILLFMIMININLAIFNLLPVPVLDGGKIMMALLEKLSVRTRKAQLPLTVASLFAIMALMLLTTIFDVVRLIGGEHLFI